MNIQRPRDTEFAPFYAGYVSLVPEGEVLRVLEDQPGEVTRLAASVPRARETHRYAPGKWSLREVLGHVTDGERVFGYRLFCIARGETASLPGFDEGAYVKASRFDERALGDLARDFAAIREANLTVLRRLDDRVRLQVDVREHQVLARRGEDVHPGEDVVTRALLTRNVIVAHTIASVFRRADTRELAVLDCATARRADASTLAITRTPPLPHFFKSPRRA